MMRPMHRRKTKIVCTLGPATDSAEGIAALIDAGMDVVRLNFSHGTRDDHRATIRRISEVAQSLGREIGILQDLGGPKIRLGVLPDEGVRLATGHSVELAVEGNAPAGTLSVSYPYLLEDVTPGETILLADGAAELEVIEVRRDRLLCRVVNGGLLTSRKGVNLPQAKLRVPAVTDKDFADLEVGLDEGVDFVALSFVRHEDDLAPVRERLSSSRTRRCSSPRSRNRRRSTASSPSSQWSTESWWPAAISGSRCRRKRCPSSRRRSSKPPAGPAGR